MEEKSGLFEIRDFCSIAAKKGSGRVLLKVSCHDSPTHTRAPLTQTGITIIMLQRAWQWGFRS
jgi:hypothetical protein